MYSQENIQRPAVGTGRVPARVPSKAQSGGGDPSGLHVLQRTAGNAAVVQMLRRAGHPGAEQHQHGANRGHQDTEPRAVQRAPADPDAMDAQDEYSDAEYVDLDYASDAYEETDLDRFREKYGRYRREVSESPQPTAGFGKSRLGALPGLVKPMRQDAKGRALPSVKYRTDNEPLYRYDTRGPDEIFAQGFAPRSDKLPRSLRLYQKVLHTGENGTAFVSTSRSPGDYIPEWAKQSNGDAFRYVINAPGGIDLVATLGTTAFLDQHEVIFWKGIRPEYIDRVEIVDSSKNVKQVLKRTDWLNPDRMDLD
ncbi:scabin-related ADP-ribosyltransferase [Streptomyces thermodiastaticus]|uniref:scabin-related ADP-ribosyltransferase n=1 Tax=Streptomyces thermodiastaticus TaxID=44061 RepID=UPI00167BEF31|nr:hypothetical protein [Streptomyces thermodiastaticus]MCE7553349.1 hypothetical protein [Streptomyces thermodiastaticus]GHF96604.1 hypothetical protein GCM10018787_51520 [Streptomyces thermodiastaticus]